MAFFEQVKITGAAGATLDGTAGSPSTGVVTVQGVASGTPQPVSGTVSVNALPTGANVIGGVELVDSAGSNKASISAAGAVKVDGSAVTQPVSAASLPLPSGASISAKQPALGTAGTASADVITVQGIASMTALKVDGSAVTQPVSDVADGSTGAAVPAKASYIGGNQSGNLTGMLLDASGFLKVNVSAGSAGNGAASNTGSAVPAQADYLGAKDGSGNLVGLLAESVTNPNLRVGIYNGTNEASVSAGGAVKVDGSAVTQPVSGSVGITAGSNLIGQVEISDGTNILGTTAHPVRTDPTGTTTQPVSISGTVATSGNTISEGTYNNTPPAPSDPSVLSVQLDQAGNLRTFAGIALQALSAQPATSGQSQVIFTNSGAESVMVQLTQTTTLTAGAITFEVSYDSSTWGTIPAQCVVDPTSSTFAAISLPYTVQASTNKQFLVLMNGAQALRIKTSTTITGTGSVTPNYALLNYDPLAQVSIVGTPAVTISGTPSVSVTGTVTANQGGAPWSVSGSGTFNTTDANAQSQGSTTSGQKGFLEMGAVTTAAPTYTTAQTSPLSLTTAGALRVDGSGVTQPVSASQTGNWTARIVGNAGSALDAAVGAATAPTNGIATLGQYNTTIPAPTAAQTVAVQVDSTGSQYANTEGRKATYSAFATFTAAAGDIAVMPGSATKTIRVTRVEVSLSTSGTAALETVELIKRSTADTGGTTGSMVTVPHDSNFSAASAAPTNYTAAPTTGTAVGPIRGIQFNDQSASLPGSATWLWEFGTRPGASAVVLRGTAQQLCVNLGGAVTTQTATVSYEWSEE